MESQAKGMGARVMIWLVLYLIVGIVIVVYLKSTGDDVFADNDLTTHLFCGFIALTWPIFLPFLVIGFIIHKIREWIDTRKEKL